jgi:hypothetical protein
MCVSAKRTPSRKCPVCVGLSTSKIEQVDAALADVLDNVRQTGEIPKVQDHRLQNLAPQLGVAPHSLQYHLKTCLYTRDIQDQLSVEIKDMISALSTAKVVYGNESTLPNAQALSMITESFIKLLKHTEGKQDPEANVAFVAEAILAPLVRKVMGAFTTEIKRYRDTVAMLNLQHDQVLTSHANNAVSKMALALRESTDESLKSICDYYKVELEAKQRLRTMQLGEVETAPKLKLLGEPHED